MKRLTVNDCPWKVGDKVAVINNTWYGDRVLGPYTVDRVLLRPRVVEMTDRSKAEWSPVEGLCDIRPWTDQLAARQRRERALDSLRHECGSWNPDPNTAVEDIEAALVALRKVKVRTGS